MFEFLKNLKGKERYGLALGSGGAKGFVHIGVIKALEELDIEITHLAGTSIGSLVGGLYALWGNISKVEDVFMSYDSKRLMDLLGGDIGLSSGILKGDAVLEEFDRYFGNANISDCIKPFVCVSVDILTGEKVYHTSGSLKSAVRASCSIPLVFRPLEQNGRFLVDGAIAESVPVEAIKSIGARRVIGVNIQGSPVVNDKKLNAGKISSNVYKTTLYHIAKKDTAQADKALAFNLSNISTKELVENRKDYIEMGYREAMSLFSK